MPYGPCSATREATTMRSLRTATREQPPLAPPREKPTQQRRPSTAKNNIILKIKTMQPWKTSGTPQKWFSKLFFFFLAVRLLLQIKSTLDPPTHQKMGYDCIGCLCSFAKSCLTLCNRMNCSPAGSSVHGISPRQEYWSGLPFPSPGDLPNPGTEPTSLLSPA